jgi:hypothetical protein
MRDIAHWDEWALSSPGRLAWFLMPTGELGLRVQLHKKDDSGSVPTKEFGETLHAMMVSLELQGGV